MSENIPLKLSENVEFGRPATVTDAEIAYNYLMVAFNSSQNICSGSSHPWVSLLTAFRSVFSSVMDETFALNPATDFNDAIAMLNLGRLARMKLEGDTYVYSVSQMIANLNRKLNGVVCSTTTGYSKYVPIATWVMGGAMDGFIGSWNSTKYKPADDVMAGCIITLCYVMFWWTGTVKQWAKIVSKLGTFSKVDGTLRGNFQPVVMSNPATWGSLLLASENLQVAQFGNGIPVTGNDHTQIWDTVGASFFGLTPQIVDDPVMRGINVTLYTQANAFWDKLLTRTEWQWRFAKSVSYEVIFCPQTIQTAGVSSPGTQEEVDMYSFMQLFNAAAGHTGSIVNNWTWWNWFVNDTVSMFKDFYFKNTSFAKIKSLFTTMPFSAVPIPPVNGLGGILVYQFAHWEDGETNDDVCMFKGLLDDNIGGHNTISQRRASDTNFRIMTIGDITIEDYRLFNSLTALSHVSIDQGESHAAVVGLTPPLRLENGFGFIVTKTEDLPYQVTRNIHWFYAAATEDNNLEYISGTEDAHPGKGRVLPRSWVNTEGFTTEHPISMIAGKRTFYYGRSSDPFKKLKHVTHDVNNFDADLVRKDMLALFWPVGGHSVKSDPIIVSAIEKPIGEVVAQEVQSGPQATTGDPLLQPVSSIASAAKDLSTAKKDVQAAEKALSVEKKKEK